MASAADLLAVLVPGECLAVDRVAAAAGVDNHRAVKLMATLIGRGYAERAEVGCYRLTPAGAAAKTAGVRIVSGPRGPLTQSRPRRPRRTTLADLVWRALRIRGKATLPDLMELAGREGTTARNAAACYLRRLEAAGYVRRLPRKETGTALTSPGYTRWQLLRDTGPAAPVWAKGRMVDRNGGDR